MVSEYLRENFKFVSTNTPYFISRYGESFALLENRCDEDGDDEYDSYLHMWAMKMYGEAESWVKLFTIHLEYVVSKPLGFTKSGRVVLDLGVECGAVLLEPKSKQDNQLQIDGICKYSCDLIDSFV